MADGERDGVATLCLGSLYMYGEVKAAVEEYPLKKQARE
jgi:hypothetical protein